MDSDSELWIRRWQDQNLLSCGTSSQYWTNGHPINTLVSGLAKLANPSTYKSKRSCLWNQSIKLLWSLYKFVSASVPVQITNIIFDMAASVKKLSHLYRFMEWHIHKLAYRHLDPKKHKYKVSNPGQQRRNVSFRNKFLSIYLKNRI